MSLTGIDFSGPRLSCPAGQNARPSSNVHHDLVFENGCISQNGGMIGRHSIMIRQHLLLMVQLCIAAKVVAEIHGPRLGITVERRNLARVGGIDEIRHFKN